MYRIPAIFLILWVIEIVGGLQIVSLFLNGNLAYTIAQTHFGQWFQLWFKTFDDLFEGKPATKAKETVGRMAAGQYITTWQNRPEEYQKAK